MDWNKSQPSNVKPEPVGVVQQMVKPFRKLGELKPMPLSKMAMPKLMVERPVKIDLRERTDAERCCNEYGKMKQKEDKPSDLSTEDMGVRVSRRY